MEPFLDLRILATAPQTSNIYGQMMTQKVAGKLSLRIAEDSHTVLLIYRSCFPSSSPFMLPHKSASIARTTTAILALAYIDYLYALKRTDLAV